MESLVTFPRYSSPCEEIKLKKEAIWIAIAHFRYSPMLPRLSTFLCQSTAMNITRYSYLVHPLSCSFSFFMEKGHENGNEFVLEEYRTWTGVSCGTVGISTICERVANYACSLFTSLTFGSCSTASTTDGVASDWTVRSQVPPLSNDRSAVFFTLLSSPSAFDHR